MDEMILFMWAVYHSVICGTNKGKRVGRSGCCIS